MICYLNDQIKELYAVSEKDYLDWCKEKKKAISYKSSVQDFVYRLRTKRLVKDMNTGKLIAKKPRRRK